MCAWRKIKRFQVLRNVEGVASQRPVTPFFVYHAGAEKARQKRPSGKLNRIKSGGPLPLFRFAAQNPIKLEQ